MGKTTSEMQLVPIGKLVPYVNNARTHSKEQITKLRSSLREFGFVNPVIIDREFNVIAGHGRVLAAKEEHIDQVPCVFVDHLTEAQKKAYILADNRFALDAGWDEDMLRVEMEALQGMDFDVSLTGFDEAEIADLLSADDEAQEDDFDVDADLQAEPFVKAGDLWLLDKHRLLCADSTKPEDVKLLMDGKKANVCMTDPPYACNYTGGTGMKIMNDNLKGEEFYQFLLSAFKNAYENLADGAAIYIFHSDAEKVNFYNAVVAAGFHYSTTCILRNHTCLGHIHIRSIWSESQVYPWKNARKLSHSSYQTTTFTV